MHKELFERKRGRKNLLKGPAVSNMSDFDFNLGAIIESESDSDGDETYLVPTSKDRAKYLRSNENPLFQLQFYL